MKSKTGTVTVVHLHSESGDHYLDAFEGNLDNTALWVAIKEEYGEEAEYLSIENEMIVRFQ